MKPEIGVTQQQIAFSQNIELCREVIYDLRYLDITNYTGLAESTMISYDTKGVAPYITVAKRIADLYCVTIERLCGSEMSFDIEEVLNMQVAFIQRLGGIPIRLYKEKIMVEVNRHLSISQYDVFRLLSDIFKQMITDLHRFGKYITIEKDNQVLVNFTRNFHNLHTFANVSYRKMGKACEISIGNIARLEQGNEPMLSSVIKFADYFSVSITQLLTAEPNFDYEKIIQEVNSKTVIRNARPGISATAVKEQAKLQAYLLDKDQAEKLISKWLTKVDA